ncbi:MAG: DUF362 domain-containing protein [Bacteroidales bacterium]|nr:DUF362 domain-containing protein [Bacteroidales bacterium]
MEQSITNIVAISKCTEYEFGQVQESMQRLLEHFGGMKQFVKQGQRVLIKPNGASPSKPENHITTHPLVLKAVIQEVKKAGGVPVIGESSAGIFPNVTEMTFRAAGFKALAEEENIELINFDHYDKYPIHKKGRKINGFYLSNLLKEVDVIINVPKLKAHEAMFLTCAVKNLYGVIPGGQKPEGHKKYAFRNNFADLLLDIYEEVKPTLNIVDGIVSLGRATNDGEKANTQVLMAGCNGINVDAVVADYVGYKLEELPIFEQVKERKMDGGDFNKIQIVGDEANKDSFNFVKADLVMLFRLPQFMLKPMMGSMVPNPVINKELCKNCLKCEKTCPVDAIQIKKGFKIDYKACIHCYCCSEVCDYKAVKLKLNNGVKKFFEKQLKDGIYEFDDKFKNQLQELGVEMSK